MWQTDCKGRVIAELNAIDDMDTYDSDREKDVFGTSNILVLKL